MNITYHTLGKPAEPTFLQWRDCVRAFFEQPEEYDLASAIYPFTTAYKDGKSPLEAFELFDAMVAI